MTMTLTEFSRSPGRAAQAVSQGEDVILTNHGADDMLLTRRPPQNDTIEAAIATGRISPAKNRGPLIWPDWNVDPANAKEAIAWFEESRRDDY